MVTNSREYMRNWRLKHPDYNRKYMEKYYSEHPEQCKASRRKSREKYRKKIRLEILELLGNKCVRCEESDVRCLQVDHINGGGGQERKQFTSTTQMFKRIVEKIKAGSKDYQILCANCNWKKKFENGEL